MPLRLTLRPREKLFLNGAVLVNGDVRADLTVLNDAAILREKEIMTETEVDTVCKEIYFLVQLIYIDQSNRDGYQDKLTTVLADVAVAAPSMAPDVDQVRMLVVRGDYYHALKVARKLITAEKELLDNVGKSS